MRSPTWPSVSRLSRHRSLLLVLKSVSHRIAQARLRTRSPAASPPSKARCWTGGLLRAVEWHRPTGERDVRGRQAVSVSLLDVLIEHRPALQRESGFTTDRDDNTVLTILDPVAITDDHTFRWGGHTYKVKAIDGVVQNAANGVLLSSEVTVIR